MGSAARLRAKIQENRENKQKTKGGKKMSCERSIVIEWRDNENVMIEMGEARPIVEEEDKKVN